MTNVDLAGVEMSPRVRPQRLFLRASDFVILSSFRHSSFIESDYDLTQRRRIRVSPFLLVITIALGCQPFGLGATWCVSQTHAFAQLLSLALDIPQGTRRLGERGAHGSDERCAEKTRPTGQRQMPRLVENATAQETGDYAKFSGIRKLGQNLLDLRGDLCEN